MAFQINLGGWNQVFAVPACVVDRHLGSADGVQLKVLLYCLRHAGEPLEEEKAAAAAGCTAQGVRDALNYWCGAGVLAQGPEFGPGEAAAPEKPEEKAEEKPKKVAPSRSIPKTSVADVLRRKKESEEVRFLLSQAESCLKKMLSSAEITTLVGLYDWAGMRVEVILMVLEYCASIGKTNMRYIERTALDWANNGIDTHEKAEEYIKKITEQGQRESLVKAAFGIYDRNLIDKEREYISAWFQDYGFSIPMIKLAYERTVERTGKLSFPYVNSILRSWYEKGVTSPKQAMEERRPPEPGEGATTSMDLAEFDRMGLLHTPKLD